MSRWPPPDLRATSAARTRSPEVELRIGIDLASWSDPELLWIVSHGLRRTGMPAFREILSPSEVADVVRYLRTTAAEPTESP